MPSEDSKPVKKEEPEDDDDEKAIGSFIGNAKKQSNNATPKSQSSKLSKVKKEGVKLEIEELEYDIKDAVSKKSSINSDKVQKKKKELEKKKKGANQTQQDGKKREKKVYDLPGQKRDPPEERDPLRIFYETLYKQQPNSEMAAIWMMESGLLPKEEAKKVFERKQRKAQQQKLGSPMKVVATVKRSVTSVTVKKKTSASPVSSQKKKTPESNATVKQSKKRKIEEASSDGGSDDDFVIAPRSSKKQKAA